MQKRMGAKSSNMNRLDLAFQLTRQMSVRELDAVIKHCNRLILQLVKSRKKNVYETLKSYLHYNSSLNRHPDGGCEGRGEQLSPSSCGTYQSHNYSGHSTYSRSVSAPYHLGHEEQDPFEYPNSHYELPYNENPEDALANFNEKWNLTNGMRNSRPSLKRVEIEDEKPRSLLDYHLIKVVGKGAFGKVVLIQSRHSAASPFQSKAARHYIGDAMNLYMVMEFVPGGDLFFHLRRKLQFTEWEAQFYAGQVILALEYLHSLSIVFRDLKPENILINYDGYVKLTDFGLAKRLSPLGRTKTMLGTAEYLAPEMFLQKPYGKSVDWWAVGILLFEMVHGRSPFRSNTDSETFEKIVSGKVKFGQTTPNFKNLVTHFLQEEPSKRLGSETVDDIKIHPWFESLNWKMLLEKRIEAPYIPRLRHRGDTRFFDKYQDDFRDLRHVSSQAQGISKDCFADF